MRIVIAPDSFKGSLSASQACAAIDVGLRRVVPEAEIVSIPMADGGEGTVDALVASTGGQLRAVTVHGPLMGDLQATYGMLGDSGTAVIEMAAAAGLPAVPVDKRNPLHTTTYGVGQLIADALQRNCRSFVIGIGGSATNDCGAGMAQALGVRFLGQDGREITDPMTGGLIAAVAAIDVVSLPSTVAESRFIVACDVDNPLLGPTGATQIYGPQKGADKKALETLEANMIHIIDLIERATGRSVRACPGAGAAGGLGAGLMAFLGAKLEPGIDIVMRECDFVARIADADIIITGEGAIDGSTIFGKTIAGIASVAGKRDIPTIALAGAIGPDAQKVLDIGVTAFLSLCDRPITLDEALHGAGKLLADAAEQAMRLIMLGRGTFR